MPNWNKNRKLNSKFFSPDGFKIRNALIYELSKHCTYKKIAEIACISLSNIQKIAAKYKDREKRGLRWYDA